MSDASQVAEVISSLVSKAQSKRVLGSELSLLLRQSFPDFVPLSFGCRNLREFIRKHVTQVHEAGRSGGDVVYSPLSVPVTISEQQVRPFPGTQDVAVGEEPSVDESVWKTFVSPTGPYRLYANPQTGGLQVTGGFQPSLPAPWVQIPPCPASQHLQIARDFIATLADDRAKSMLSQTLSYEYWWVAFLAAARRVGLEKDWFDYRRHRLWQELKRGLDAYGIPPTGLSLQVSGVARGLEAGRRFPAPRRRDEGFLRKVAIGALRRMPIAELREIRMPLGYVVDEIQNT